eukprot:1648643-Karenia_brevis.AAC.1
MREFKVPDNPGDEPVALDEPPGSPSAPEVTSPIEEGEPDDVPEDVNFRILKTRIRTWSETPNCAGCTKMSEPGYLHTKECRKRFYKILRDK